MAIIWAVVNYNKMCLSIKNVPNNGQFQRWQESQGQIF